MCYRSNGGPSRDESVYSLIVSKKTKIKSRNKVRRERIGYCQNLHCYSSYNPTGVVVLLQCLLDTVIISTTVPSGQDLHTIHYFMFNQGKVLPRPLYCTITSAASALLPLCLRGLSSTSCRPSDKTGGMSLPAARAFVSAQCRKRTRLRIRASPRAPMLVRIASFTLLATLRRREGSRSTESSLCKVPVAGKNISNDIVSSRSFRKSWFVAARGANCVDAKFNTGVMSEVADDVHVRMSSMSCRRSNAK